MLPTVHGAIPIDFGKCFYVYSPYGFCLKVTVLIIVVSLFTPHADGVLVLKSAISYLNIYI